MNKKIIGGVVYSAVLAGLWSNILTRPRDFIRETYAQRIEVTNGVIYVINGEYKNLLGQKVDSYRVEAVNGNKILSEFCTANPRKIQRLVDKAVKSLDGID